MQTVIEAIQDSTLYPPAPSPRSGARGREDGVARRYRAYIRFFSIVTALGVFRSIGFRAVPVDAQEASILAANAASAPDEARYQKTFMQLDADHDGGLSEAEFLQRFSKPEETAQKKKAFMRHDLDQDARLSLDEFLVLPSQKPTEQRWFAMLDRNADERLSYEEFMAYRPDENYRGRHRRFFGADLDEDSFLGSAEFSQVGISTKAPSKRAAFEMDDIDRNGSVDFSEFVTPNIDESAKTYFQRWFEAADENSNDRLSPEEHMNKSADQGEVAFVRKDLDLNRRLTLAEFLGVAFREDSFVSQQRNVFWALDADENKELDETEFLIDRTKSRRIAFTKLDTNADHRLQIRELFRPPPVAKGSNDSQSSPNPVQQNVNVFELFDEDQDGSFSVEEFFNYETKVAFFQNLLPIPMDKAYVVAEETNEAEVKTLSSPMSSKTLDILLGVATCLVGLWVVKVLVASIGNLRRSIASQKGATS